jgi:hypothetical protein
MRTHDSPLTVRWCLGGRLYHQKNSDLVQLSRSENGHTEMQQFALRRTRTKGRARDVFHPSWNLESRGRACMSSSNNDLGTPARGNTGRTHAAQLN